MRGIHFAPSVRKGRNGAIFAIVWSGNVVSFKYFFFGPFSVGFQGYVVSRACVYYCKDNCFIRSRCAIKRESINRLMFSIFVAFRCYVAAVSSIFGAFRYVRARRLPFSLVIFDSMIRKGFAIYAVNRP